MGVGTNFSPDYAGASVIPTDHFWPGRKSHPVRWIVVHGTAGGTRAADVAAYFQTNNPATSTHYVVGLEGEIVQCVPESDTAWGNGIVTTGADPWWNPADNPNYSTISIEHVKSDTQNNGWLTAAQQAASFALIAYLVKKYNIPVQAATADGGIAAHREIDPVNKVRCPGPYPWGALFDMLQQPSIEDLHTQIKTLQDQNATLESQISDLNTRISAIKQDLSTTQMTLDAVRQKYNGLIDDIHALIGATPA